MSLDELKKNTACADCGQTGHWRGDQYCPRRSNTTVKEEPDPDAEEEWDYEGYEWHDGYEHQWSGWTDEYSWQADDRSAHALQRQHQKIYKIGDDAATINKHADQLRRKARKLDSTLTVGPAAPSQRSSSQVTKSDYFLDKSIVEDNTYGYVKNILEASKASSSSGSAGPTAVASAQRQLGPDKTYDEVGSVWQLLQDKSEKPDVDKMCVKQSYTRRKVDLDLSDDELLPDIDIVRGACSLARRKPTVEAGRCYLTIDTACENTVCGSIYMDFLATKLKEQNFMALQQPEREQYCFGPGKPQTSTTRLSVPIGIGGVPTIIRTSLVREDKLAGGQGPNGISFLAGQDWLLMMKAVIDIGQNLIRSPLLGIDVPIQVDVSGHLVIAIDEYPKNGWPPGLTTSLDLYPEAVFAAGRHRPCEDGDQPDAKRAKKKERQSSTPSASTSKTYFIPNFIYKPNLDTMNTDITKGPCSVPADYWEYDLKKGIVIRHHCRPRCSRFHPEEAHDRPDTSDWMSHRVTCVAGTSPVLDDWRCPFVDWVDMFFHETFRCESTTPITTNFWSCGDI